MVHFLGSSASVRLNRQGRLICEGERIWTLGPPRERGGGGDLFGGASPGYFPAEPVDLQTSQRPTHRMYRAPDFSQPRFANAPAARFAPAPADGVLPEGFFSTTNLPTYVRLESGEWKLPRDPRMDSALVLDADGIPRVLEARYVRGGQPVAMGFAEDGSDGIFVHASGLMGAEGDVGPEGEFKFMSSEVSREKPTDYGEMARILVDERERGGHFIWVVGPAVLHSRGRDTLAWFIREGYVGALFGGNAVAVHDIESATMGTTLGMNNRGIPMEGGHAFHMRAINRVRAAGSTAGCAQTKSSSSRRSGIASGSTGSSDGWSLPRRRGSR